MAGLTALPLIAISLMAGSMGQNSAAQLAPEPEAAESQAAEPQAAEPQAAEPQERQISVEAPTAVLTGLDFAVELEMTSGPPGAFTLRTADGRLLAGGDLVAGQTATVAGLTLNSASEAPIRFSWTEGGQATETPSGRWPGRWTASSPPP